ncbi:WD40-repeat-containing domain protein [Lineolata rhizophorae]|uniref:WD40-repeat-containing domain protein n=1 Tax=Lineolata rhizophorae TaxID=578093 RepID=A0A6A6PC46_9PEZI|nr:WD40-repeat-containing domain protein [Lineolata rhizophorae]
MSIDVSLDGRFTASGHENGGVYIFNNETGRMHHSLQGLQSPVRAVRFSPGGTLLAATGDARIIALYDVASGEQVAALTGHSAWILSLDFNSSGEYLLSGAHDGKAKVWSVQTRACVATHSETDQPLWAVRWLPKAAGAAGAGLAKAEMFAVAGKTGGIEVYREASGGG